MRSTKRLSRFGALALAISLVGASCGGGAAETTAAAGGDEVVSDEVVSDDAVSDSTESAPEESADEDNTDAADSQEADEAASDEAVVNLFPDIDVSNVSDGSTVNLAAELGGGDTPVLLWFWAPH